MTELRDLAEKRGAILHFDPRKLRVKDARVTVKKWRGA